MIHRWKFSQQPALAQYFAQALLRDNVITQALASTQVLVPVPLSLQRLRERGYNPAAQLARYLCRHSKKLHHALQALERTRHTARQSSLPRTKRWSNLQGAFVVPDAQRHQIHGQHIALLDDVMTTGSTLHAASQALHEAGAASITAICVARTLHEGSFNPASGSMPRKIPARANTC